VVAASALALAGGSASLAAASPAAHSGGPDYYRACAVQHKANVASCMALILKGVKQRTEAQLGTHGFKPTGFGYGRPALTKAYKLPSSSPTRNVAVIDAYNDPDAVSNYNTYRSSWGLAACNTSTEAGCLTVTNQNGAASPLPSNAGDTGWDVEESLDVDMVAAICPNCHVFLVEASSADISDLGTAVNSAVSVLGADYVSNSYGAGDSSSDSTYDSLYYNHSGVAVTASAGDSGYGVSYPAASQYVTAVGGTTLHKKTSTSRGWKETVWGSASGGEGTGSGCSTNEAKPSWQTDSPGCSGRTDNDVSSDANPSTGVAIYDTYSEGGWLEVGGTSVSSPTIASVFALAGVPAAGTYPSSYPYADQSALFDVTSGANGSCSPAYLCHAEVGYDGPTGLGTPDGVNAFKS
jgi:subtilase family serine protease